jgi:UDP-N-acetyl-D-mannosaminuronate dehydrogenase
MEKKIVVIGLGCVSLPVSVEFAKKYLIIGFDVKGILDVENIDTRL